MAARRHRRLCSVFGPEFVCVWRDCLRCSVRVGWDEEMAKTGQRKVVD